MEAAAVVANTYRGSNAQGQAQDADSSSYLSRLLAVAPSLRVAVLSHDSTKLYTGARDRHNERRRDVVFCCSSSACL